MPQSVTLEPHLSPEELKRRYQNNADPEERSKYQIIWLLTIGKTVQEVSNITNHSNQRVYIIASRYHRLGEKGLRDRQHQSRKVDYHLETLCYSQETFTFDNQEDHVFDLILSYPLRKEFLNEADLKQKIAQFHNHVLHPEQYILNFKVSKVLVGYSSEYYLIGFSGAVSGKCLEVKTTEIVTLLTTLLEAFFLCVAPGEFNPLLFALDGQVVIQPTPQTEGIPKEYDFTTGFEDFIRWNLEYLVADLIYLLGEIVVESSAHVLGEIATGVAESSGELLVEGAGEIMIEVASESIGLIAEATGSIIEAIAILLV